MLGPGLMHWGTLSSFTLPPDNGTWAVGLVVSSKDRALRSVREADRWEAAVRALPLVAHWLDGTPIDDGVATMAGLEDRYRSFVIDGDPVATGVVAAADSRACSNPANGRGASIGMLHALTLRDQLRAVGLDDPAEFAEAFHAATAETVEPWYRTTLAGDRHRIGEIEAGIWALSTTPPTRPISWRGRCVSRPDGTRNACGRSSTSGSCCERPRKSSPSRGCAGRPLNWDQAGATRRRWVPPARSFSH